MMFRVFVVAHVLVGGSVAYGPGQKPIANPVSAKEHTAPSSPVDVDEEARSKALPPPPPPDANPFLTVLSNSYGEVAETLNKLVHGDLMDLPSLDSAGQQGSSSPSTPSITKANPTALLGLAGGMEAMSMPAALPEIPSDIIPAPTSALLKRDTPTSPTSVGPPASQRKAPAKLTDLLASDPKQPASGGDQNKPEYHGPYAPPAPSMPPTPSPPPASAAAPRGNHGKQHKQHHSPKEPKTHENKLTSLVAPQPSAAFFPAGTAPPPPLDGRAIDINGVTAERLRASTDRRPAGRKDEVLVTWSVIHGDMVPSPSDITLSLQADIKRAPAVVQHALTWQGPVSIAILVGEADVEELNRLLRSFDHAVVRWLDIHVCYHEKPVAKGAVKDYPINAMRNVALERVSTEWVMVVDIDDSVVSSMQSYKQAVGSAEASVALSSGSASSDQADAEADAGRVYCVGSWQWTSQAGDIPSSKEELMRMQAEGRIALKHPNFPVAYFPPLDDVGIDVTKLWMDTANDQGFLTWSRLEQPVAMTYRDSYEPYFIARRDTVPPFDARFVGFMGNAAFHTLQMAATGHNFVLLPDLFTFSNDTVRDSMALRLPKDPSLLLTAYKDLGDKVGCPMCVMGNCLSHCPWVLHSNSKP